VRSSWAGALALMIPDVNDAVFADLLEAFRRARPRRG
jgi:hypothetical protein